MVREAIEIKKYKTFRDDGLKLSTEWNPVIRRLTQLIWLDA